MRRCSYGPVAQTNEGSVVHPRRSTRRPDAAIRYLAWLCLFLTLWPSFVGAADTAPPAAVPVVTNVSGAVVVRSASGVSRDVLSSRIVHPGDTLVTGVDSIALLSLADVGSVRLGPGSTATASSTPTSLAVSLDLGSVCAQAQSRGVTVQTGGLSLAAGDDTAIFSLIRDADSTTIAVYQGQISAGLHGKPPAILHAGEAAVSSHGGSPVQVPIQTVQPQFAALKCPDDAIIAKVVPSPEPSSQGGHGGGGGGFLGILAGLGVIAALAGGHGGGGGGGSPPPTSPPGPGVLSLSQSSLSFPVDGATQSFTASESNYAGPINASSSNTAVATVSPASGAGPSATFTVTPTGVGSASITVTDNHGGTQIVSVTVALPGTLTVSTSSLSFLVGGATQTFTASESSYAGAINASSGNASVATVTPASGAGPGPITFTVTPTGAGSTSITITDDHGGKKTVSITVTPPGSISVVPGSLTLAVSGASQTFTASESSYTGAITAVSNDPTVATVSGSGTGPGPVTFTVSPVGAGTTTITVHGGDGPATVNVTVAGPVGVTPTSLTFSGSTASQSFLATDPFFTGTLSASSDNTAVATVAPASASGPSATFNVTPVSEGSAHITVSDTLGQSAQVSIIVSAGGLVVNPTSLTFTVTGPTQTFTASEADYTGLITATSTLPGEATVAPASQTGVNPFTFTVTPVAAGNPQIAVSDTHAHTKFVAITVTGPLTPTPTSLTFNGTTATQSIGVTDPNYVGSITASSTDLSVATVTSPGVGPSASFTVTPANQPSASGTATINFSDSNGGTTSASVHVNAGSLGVSKPSISLVGFGTSDSFTASETLYSGPISAASTNTGIATVSPASASGPGPNTYTVTAAGPGTATIDVTDNHGGLQTVGVTVTETPTVTPGTLPTFTDTGSGSTQTASISEPGYSGTFSVVANSCTSIATVGPIAGTGPSATVPVTALATTVSGGSCQFSVKDDINGGVSSPVSVTVGPFGSVVPAPSTLTFSDVGAGAAQTFTVSESGYTGTFTLDTSGCPSSVATVSPTTGNASTTFTVTPVFSGTCTISVGDDHTQTATVTATVASFGPITPTPTSLTFSDVGAGAAKTFTATESGYGGLLTADASACAGAATVSPASGPSGTTFTVTPVSGGGPCNINITDDHTQTAAVSVTVGPFGAITVTPTSIGLSVGGSSATFTVSETGYTGNFTIDASTCATNSVATESPSSGNNATTFTVTPGTSVGNCNIGVSDDHGGSQTILTTLVAGAIVLTPVTLSFADTSSPSQTFTAFDLGATTYNAIASDKHVATVSPATQFGPGLVTFTVSVGNKTGQASITVSDDAGGSAVVSVGVGVSPLIKKRQPIGVHKAVQPKPVATPTPRPHMLRPVHGPVGPIGPHRIVTEGGGPPGLTPQPTPSPMPTSVPPLPSPGQTPPPQATGQLTVSAANLVFVAGAAGQTIVISEPGYARRFTMSTSNAAVAGIGAGASSGPTASVTITPRGAGVATIRIADDHGGMRTITVIVRAPLPSVPRPVGRSAGT